MYNFVFSYLLSLALIWWIFCLVYSCLCMPFVIIFFSIANISRRRLMARSHVNANTYTMQVSKERIWFFFLLWIELTDFKAEEEREKCIEKSSYLIEQANNVQNSNNTTMLVGMGHHRSCCLMLVHFFCYLFIFICTSFFREKLFHCNGLIHRNWRTECLSGLVVYLTHILLLMIFFFWSEILILQMICLLDTLI